MTPETTSGLGIAWDALRAALAERGFRLEREIGHGGMAHVYQAFDLKHQRPVAIKVLKPGAALGVERFLREIRLVSPLTHPHIVPVYDSGQVYGAPYFVMPLIEGETLRGRLKRGVLAEPDAVQIAREVADALAYAHARGITHRDIKPENILLHAGHALVGDFGVAMAPSASTPGATERLTDAGIAIGTADYMSPEQASGDTLDGRSDLYSLGCVLYEMLTGQPPFSGGSARVILSRRFRDPPPSVRRTRPEASATVDRAIVRALALDPEARFATVSEFARVLAGEMVAPAVPHAWRRAWPLAVLALACLVALALLVPDHRRSLDPNRVVVGRFSNETGEDSLNYLGSVAAERVRLAVARTGALTVATSATILPSRVNPGLVVDTLDDPQRLHTLAAETGAGLVISGSYYRSRGDISFLCEITDANQGKMVQAIGPITTRVMALQSGLDSLSRAVARSVVTMPQP